jgi:hypothetical protein
VKGSSTFLFEGSEDHKSAVVACSSPGWVPHNPSGHISELRKKESNGRAMAPWLRRLAAGLPSRRPGFDPGSVHVGFVVDKVALRQFPPPPEYFGLPLSISFHRCSITWKRTKNNHHRVAQEAFGAPVDFSTRKRRKVKVKGPKLCQCALKM